MLVLKYLLLATGVGLFLAAGGVVARQVAHAVRRLRPAGAAEEAVPIFWARPLRLAALALVPLLLGASVVVLPAGKAGIRVSQISGTRPGTLYPGVHLVQPLIESVALYDIREHVLTTATSDDPKRKIEVLKAQSKEGLAIGLVLSVRYRLDPQRLDYIHANLPQPPEEELVPPVVGSVFRQLVPNYEVRDVFATRREELRQKAAVAIAQRLAPDGILVKEVMLRDVVLPAEYAKGLEGLLLKEQENERMVYELQVKEKQVRGAELEAEAQKARDVKGAEARAQVHLLEAKAEADAMQHTLPLKEKQIQQTRLEAEAQAKVIESKAEAERSRLMADAEANRIRITSAADSERMKLEAEVLKDNPLLIQKIVAERLSDKMQIMMVPMDGRYFFANDIFRGPMTNGGAEPGPPQPQGTSRSASARP